MLVDSILFAYITCVYIFFNLRNVRLLSTSLDQKKSEPCKGKSVSLGLGILYPEPKISNPDLSFKFCWREILPLALGITSFWRQIGYSLGLEIPRDSSRGFIFAFPRWCLLCFSFLGELHLFYDDKNNDSKSLEIEIRISQLILTHINKSRKYVTMIYIL